MKSDTDLTKKWSPRRSSNEPRANFSSQASVTLYFRLISAWMAAYDNSETNKFKNHNLTRNAATKMSISQLQLKTVHFAAHGTLCSL